MGKTILAIGGHIGDMELTAGGVMATNALEGGKNYTLALTAGERGNPPHLSVEEYRLQKIEEAKAFMAMMNGEALVLEYLDGELPNDEKVRYQVANVIRQVQPDVILTHWKSTMHKDHHNTHLIVPDAAFLASVVDSPLIEGKRKWAPVYFCENWEDAEEFEPYVYIDITKGYELWSEAMKTHWFIMNSKSFDYYDYYRALARCRGALSRKLYAQCFAVWDRQKKIVKEGF